MKAREATKEYRLSEWARILQDRKESRVNIRAYCKGAGIPEHQYYYWQRKLREAACEGLATTHPDSKGIAPLGFVEVKTPVRCSLHCHRHRPTAAKGNAYGLGARSDTSIKACHRLCCRGGRFILSTGDQCGRDTHDENIFALIQTARSYGRY